MLSPQGPGQGDVFWQFLYFAMITLFGGLLDVGTVQRIGVESVIKHQWTASCVRGMSEWVGFNVPLDTRQVISETSLSKQLITLVMIIKQ